VLSASGHQVDSYWTSIHERFRGTIEAVGYPGYGEGFNRATYRLRLSAAGRVLQRNIPTAIQNVLESAVGVGAYGPLWKSLGAVEWVGLDISATAIRDLAAKYPKGRFAVADIAKVDFGRSDLAKNSFDLVTAIDVLYHLVDDQGFNCALLNLGRRVRQGGYLLVSDIFCTSERQTAPHVRRRPLTCYGDRLKKLGFTLADREAVFAILGDPIPKGEYPGVADHLLFTLWRIVAKAALTTPASARDFVGTAVVRLATPLDTMLRTIRITQGRNLELALFRRDQSFTTSP